MEEELTILINKELSLELPANISFEELKMKLSGYINEMISTDFERLLSLLYRIDVNEQKLKSMLQEYKGEDAGKIIAALIIERQRQKLESRKKSRTDPGKIDEEEKW